MKIIKCVDCKGINGNVCGFPIQQIPASCEMMRDWDAWVDLDKKEISTLYSRSMEESFKGEKK